jgi:hypothetical protein
MIEIIRISKITSIQHFFIEFYHLKASLSFIIHDANHELKEKNLEKIHPLTNKLKES